jgi:hypothetical protein
MILAHAQEVIVITDAAGDIEAVCLPCHGGREPSWAHFYRAKELLPAGWSNVMLSRRWRAWVIGTRPFISAHLSVGTPAIPRGMTIFFPEVSNG